MARKKLEDSDEVPRKKAASKAVPKVTRKKRVTKTIKNDDTFDPKTSRTNFDNVYAIIYECHKRNSIKICAIDIGHRNFALCIEELPLPLEKGVDVKQQGEITSFYVKDFGVRKNNGIDDRKIFFACTDFLDSIIDELMECDIILIEQQLKRNPFAQKMEQHVYTYLTIVFRSFKYYTPYNASNKTQVLKAPKGMDKPERKKWCSEKCCEILAERGDEYSLEIISRTKKIDDLCDTFCMIQAWKIQYYKYLRGVEK